MEREEIEEYLKDIREIIEDIPVGADYEQFRGFYEGEERKYEEALEMKEREKKKKEWKRKHVEELRSKGGSLRNGKAVAETDESL